MLKILSIALLTFFSTYTYADVTDGKALFDEQNCIKCHAVNKFSPKKNKVNNFKKLHKQVERCSSGTSTGWFEEEVLDVSNYLNANFYHFKTNK